MIEKLLENWLDSASERSYQAVFVQMLSGQGFQVVHSTRHTSLEFGKDILAIAPDGTGCAYQLKGNPGGKLGLAQFRAEIQGQLVQLMSQAVVYPGFPSGTHRSFLVSNGFFEEEVQRAVDDLNRMPYPSKVTLISRGDLLDWCKRMGSSLWPSELTDARLLLELFLADPRNVLPIEKVATLLGKVLLTEPTGAQILGRGEFDRAVTSAALLTGIATAPFAEAKNHYAVAIAWGLFAVSIVAACGRHRQTFTGAALATFKLAEAAALDALAELWEEVDSRTHLVEGNAVTDSEVYGWRYIVLLGALSCLAIAHDAAQILHVETSAKLNAWLRKRHDTLGLWGEGAVGALVPWLVYLRKHDSTIRPDLEIAGITEVVISSNQHDSTSPLPSPYYDFEEVIRFRLKLDKSGEASSIGRETLAGSSYTAEALFHLLARTNLKSKCKALWVDFTKLGHRRFVPEEAWMYCTLDVTLGVDETKIYPSTYEWTRLRKEAREDTSFKIPEPLAVKPWLLALWWQIAPQRYNTISSRHFATSLIPGWGS